MFFLPTSTSSSPRCTAESKRTLNYCLLRNAYATHCLKNYTRAPWLGTYSKSYS